MPNPFPPRARHLVAAVVLAVGLAGCSVAGKETPGGSESTTKAAAPKLEVPVYFVGHTPQGPRLFLERHHVSGSDALAAAVAAAVARPQDHDYRSLLPRVSIDAGAPVGLHRRGDRATFTIAVGGRRWTRRPHGMSGAEARLAVQQLLYTMRAAAGGAVGAARIEFRLGGRTVRFLGVPSGAVAAAPTRTLALVNVLAPTEGTTLGGDTLSASGLADAFEAHVPWRVLDDRGRQVLKGFTTAAGWGNRLYPWRASVDIGSLRPGRYRFVATTTDPSGGEGFGPTEDTKTFRVS